MGAACRIVTERHRRPRADENGAGVADAIGDCAGVAGLNLEVFGGIGVDHVDALVEIVHQHDRGLLPRQRRPDALGVPGGRHLRFEFGADGLRQLDRIGDQHRPGQRIVLGLADQVGGDVAGIGGVVGQDRDLGRAGLGVDADQSAQQSFGGHHVDVAGAGDQVDRLAQPWHAVGEHRDRLCSADRIHLGHAEQRAHGQNRRVRLPAELGLRGRRNGDGRHARHLRGHHVHQHRGRQRRQSPGHVQADPVDGRRTSLDHRSRRGFGAPGFCPRFEFGDRSPTADRLDQGGAQLRGQVALGSSDDVRGHQERRGHTPIEALGELAQGVHSTAGDRVTDRTHPLDRVFDVHRGARNDGAVVDGLPTQVKGADHPPDSTDAARLAAALPVWQARPPCVRLAA